VDSHIGRRHEILYGLLHFQIAKGARNSRLHNQKINTKTEEKGHSKAQTCIGRTPVLIFCFSQANAAGVVTR
jgi:hypothetical protein